MSSKAADRLLRVDLTAERVVSERIPSSWLRSYIGGKGLGARYLYEELAPGTDPLGSDNVLLFVLGPLTGYLPGEDRYAAVTRSPLTGTFLDSYAGGDFPSVLAGALDDHLGVLITGRADRPVALVVEDGDARMESAERLWGETTVETCRAFADAAVACVGPAGENRVRYATIASDDAEHHAGRGGAGAVMGAKRLKAVVARGDPPEPDPELATLRDRDERRYRATPTGEWQAASGTVETVDFADTADVLAARGWQQRGFESSTDVGIAAVRERAHERERREGVPGGFRLETDAGETVPRGATGMTLGAGLGLEEFDAVAELGERCNRLGLDLISGGNAVALAIRATDAGVVDRDLSFGDPDDARRLLTEIAGRETELGDVLADGVESATDRLADDRWVPTVKEMSLPSYDPRAAANMALAYATSDRGACHRRARPVERAVFEESWGPREVAEAVIEAQNGRSVRWSLVADDFVGEAVSPTDWLDALDVPHDDLERTGERIWTLVRLFNVREGFDRDDDAFPSALDVDDTDAFSHERFETMLDTYYALREWSPAGLPTRAALERLDLLDVRDERTPVGTEVADP